MNTMIAHCIKRYIRKLCIQGRSQDLAGGGDKNFFSDFKICTLLGVFGGILPREIFLYGAIWCLLVHIWIKFSLFEKSFKNYHFLNKNNYKI